MPNFAAASRTVAEIFNCY